MSNDDNISNEQNDTFDSKPKKLKSTKGLHLGNHFADTNNCKYCEICHKTFTVFEFSNHQCIR